ncbi:MAG: glycine cleavage T C-terminal barrel domain-containing protein [Pseudomonadota bacterium]
MGFELAMGARVRKSPFFQATVDAGVRAFTVYNRMYMPTSYGDPQAEYRRLTEGVAMWDVAVERQVQISGPDARDLVRHLLPRDLANLQIGRGKYVPVCDHNGILLNDPVLLQVDESTFWLSIADSDLLLWVRGIAAERGADVSVTEPDVSPLAIQGPKAEDVVASMFGDWVRTLRYFWFQDAILEGIPLVVARSGWSKQGGFELYLRDGFRGVDLWNIVAEAGRPFGIGPGTPNPVERTESGLISYGADTDENANPYEMGLGRYVDLDRPDHFVGKAALKRLADSPFNRRRTGLFLDGGPIDMPTQPLTVTATGAPVGRLSVAVHSPRLDRMIGIGLLEPAAFEPDAVLAVQTDQGPRAARVTDLPFI